MKLPRSLALLIFSLVLPLAWARAASSVLVCGGSMMNGDHFLDSTLPAMREHFAGCKKIALVLHATHPTERDAMEARLQKAFAHLGGFEAVSVHHFDAAGQNALLEKADGIFVGGGETFVLLGELHRLGQLDVIRRRVAAGVPYAGTSAGANVAGVLIGTTNDFPVADIPTRQALGIFPSLINPHHPLPATKADYDARAGKLAIYLKFNPTETVVALANASIAVCRDGKVSLVAGTGWIYRVGKSRELKLGEVVPEISR